MIPSERSSGEKRQLGRITKAHVRPTPSAIPCARTTNDRQFYPPQADCVQQYTASYNHCKEAAAQRWVKAVNAEGSFGRWGFRIARNPNDVGQILATSSLEAWLGRLTSFYKSRNIAPQGPHLPAQLFNQIGCNSCHTDGGNDGVCAKALQLTGF